MQKVTQKAAKSGAEKKAFKEQQLAFLRDRFGKSASAVLTDFRGLNVESDTLLRREFKKSGVEYKVVKNTLIERAVTGTSNEPLIGFLDGPTGIAWSYGDPSLAAKVITAFRKQHDKLRIKGAILDGHVLDPKSVEELAKMPGRDELRATFLATLQAPLQNFLRLLNAAPQTFMYALSARETQLKEKSNG